METITNVPLTALDRCDRCNAAAKIRAGLLNGELMFCGHHAKKYRMTLEKASIHIYDPEMIYEANQ